MQREWTYLGIPFTAGISVPTMVMGYTRAISPNSGRGVYLDPRSNTVAGHNFNDLFCRCLCNENCPKGERYKYFAMLHHDVAPLEEFWLDAMIDELERCRGDVIHASVCIKDDRGLVSTALGNMDDEWDAHRRLTSTELYKLPETFGLIEVLKGIDLAGAGFEQRRVCLCPNTGCMVVKLGDWCRSFPGFEQRSRITWTQDGPVAELSSEDWRFGRWCAHNGLRVLGTRKVTTAHIGQFPWATSGPGGRYKTDEDYLSLIQKRAEHERNRPEQAGQGEPSAA